MCWKMVSIAWPGCVWMECALVLVFACNSVQRERGIYFGHTVGWHTAVCIAVTERPLCLFDDVNSVLFQDAHLVKQCKIKLKHLCIL